MKTAVSVPDELFERADRLARTAGLSRSEVYSRALREYVARHSADQITDALNHVVSGVGDDMTFVRAAARGTLERSAW